MGSHSRRKQERKELRRTLRIEQKERHRLKRAEKAARKERKRLRRKTEKALALNRSARKELHRSAHDHKRASHDTRKAERRRLRELRYARELDELRRRNFLRASGAPTDVELMEARAWRDQGRLLAPQYAPQYPTPAELDELRRRNFLRASGAPSDVELMEARAWRGEQAPLRPAFQAARQARQTTAKSGIHWDSGLDQTTLLPNADKKVKGNLDIVKHLADRTKKAERDRRHSGQPINSPRFLIEHKGAPILAEIVKGRTQNGKLEFKLEEITRKEGKDDEYKYGPRIELGWYDAAALQLQAKGTPLETWCADQIAKNCVAESYP